MKKSIVTIVTLLTVSMLMMTGCSQNEQQDAGNATESMVQERETQDENEEQVSEVTGVIESKNDFMFIVTDSDDASYAFTFSEKPEGLDEVEAGDKVIVKYTGTVSEIDPFVGEVLSVEKQ